MNKKFLLFLSTSSFVGLLALFFPFPVGAASVLSLGDVRPIAINNTSNILIVEQNGNIAIWRSGKITQIGMIAPHSAVGINNLGHILINFHTGSGENIIYIWHGGQKHSIGSKIIHGGNGLGLDNSDKILINDNRGTGLYYEGTVQWLIKPKRSYTIQATGINDKHQVIGVIMGPLTKSKSDKKFTARAFVWQHGVFTYLKSIGPGFLYPTSINNSGKITGEFRPMHRGLTRQAILWKNSHSLPIQLDSLLSDTEKWQLQTASGINDKNEIIGAGNLNGKHRAFMLTLSENGL